MKKDKKPENKKKNRTIYYLTGKDSSHTLYLMRRKVFLMAFTVKPIKLNKSKTILNC